MNQALPTRAGSKFREGAGPKYLAMKECVVKKIKSGELAHGVALPTEESLAKTFSVSRGTVRQALGDLEREGMIQRVQGRGMFVTTEQQPSRQQLDIFALISFQLRENFFPALVHGFEQASATIQHQVLVSNSNNDVGRQADLVLQMIDAAVGGVALVPVTSASTPAHHIRQLQKNQIPVVFCHRSAEGIPAPCVTWSGREVGRQAAQALLEAGHRRIGMIRDYSTTLIREYEAGLRESLVEAGLAPSALAVATFGDHLSEMAASKAIAKALTSLLSAPDRPTAIFCGNVSEAEQVYLQASDFGLRIPHDLSLIYFGGSLRGHGLAERMTCASVAEHDVGAKAAQLLHEMRCGKRALDNDERIEFPITLLPGETIGPPAKL